MVLVWANHAALSEQLAAELRSGFAAEMEGAHITLVQGEAAPALRVSIERTSSRIVFTASVPAEGSTNVVIEEVERALAGTEDPGDKTVRLEKQLIWRQEARILSAALLNVADSADKRLAVLTDETLEVYRGQAGNWKREDGKELPAPRPARRSTGGQIIASEDWPNPIGLLFPGRRCEVNLADASAISCSPENVDWPAGRLMTAPGCGLQTWWLKNEAGDFVSEDRLSLRVAGAARDSSAVAEMSFPGPVYSIAAAEDSASSTVTVRNLETGNYEVYRVALACGD